MKKYLNKALVYKEWKAVYWILIPLILFSSKALVISYLIDEVKIGDGVVPKASSYGAFFSPSIPNFITIILVILMAYIIMNGDRRENVKSLISYMPFNIKQRMVSKIVVGELIIFLSCFMGFIINTIMYEGNINYLSKLIRFQYIVFYLIISFFLYTIIYVLFVYIQCFCKSGVFGTILAASILTLPSSVENLLYYFTHSNIIFKLDFLSFIYYLRLPLKYGFKNGKEYVKGYNFLPATIELIAILAVISILFILFIKKAKVGEGMMLKTSAKKEKAFKMFSSISIGIFAAKGLSKLLNTQQSLSICVILVNIIFIAAAYFAYTQIDKIIKLSKYDRGE